MEKTGSLHADNEFDYSAQFWQNVNDVYNSVRLDGTRNDTRLTILALKYYTVRGRGFKRICRKRRKDATDGILWLAVLISVWFKRRQPLYTLFRTTRRISRSINWLRTRSLAYTMYSWRLLIGCTYQIAKAGKRIF